MKEELKKITGKQVVVYVLALFILGCGVSMNTKTNLGVSPVISVAYSIAQILQVPIGTATFVYYCFLVLLQFLMLRGKLPLFQILQVGASFITSLFIQVFDYLLPIPTSVVGRGAMLVIAITLTGIGASLSLGMRIVPNPADGLVRAIGECFHVTIGLGKNILDAICIVIAIVIGLVFAQRLIGIGIGTVACVIFTGRVMALFQPITNRIAQGVCGN